MLQSMGSQRARHDSVTEQHALRKNAIEQKGRDWGDASTNEGTPRIASQSLEAWGEA